MSTTKFNTNIYIIVNDINDKVYVGKTSRTLKKRWWDHKTDSLRYPNHPMYVDMIAYGYDKFHLIPICNSTKEHAELIEQYFIKLFHSLYPNGYNLTSGGEYGKKYCGLTKEKISKALTGRSLSYETRQKMRLARLKYLDSLAKSC